MELIRTPLKWVGSKARIMETLRPHLPAGDRLVEPFAGSCAVMMNTDYESYLIADVNQDLIHMYVSMVGFTDRFLHTAENLFETRNTPESYYSLRLAFNSKSHDSADRAALFFYLNRHCFNGLCRYNQKGEFNVPFGKYKKPYFPEKEICAFVEKAKRAEFICGHYSETLSMVKSGDVVYCDPPYLTDTDNFTAYHTQGFTHLDHGRLSRKLRRLSARGIPVIASNSDLDMVRYLYSGFCIEPITAPRSVGAAPGSQKSAGELIIKSGVSYA